MPKSITVTEAVNILHTHKRAGAGRVFGVTFVKRTDNTIRTLNARFGVTSALKGGKRAYDFGDKGLMCVYDINGKSYKTINVSGLRALNVDGNEYIVQ